MTTQILKFEVEVEANLNEEISPEKLLLTYLGEADNVLIRGAWGEMYTKKIKLIPTETTQPEQADAPRRSEK
jgi:hypothetical protein